MPPLRIVLTAQWSTAGYPFGGRRRELCAAWRVQANGGGGLVGIFVDGFGHVSVVGSTLTNITVRAHS